MADKKGAEVEKWKQSKETKAFMKNLKRLHGVRRALEAEGMKKQQELNTITDLYREVRISYDGLIADQPQTKLQELPGMSFEEGREEEGSKQGDDFFKNFSPEQMRISY